MQRLLPALVAGSLAACSAPKPADVASPSVLVLLVDGARSDELSSTAPSDLTGIPGEDNAARIWDELAPKGAVVRALVNTGVTVTAPAHAALLTGHAEPYANFPVDGEGGPGLYRPLTPTLFEEVERALGAGTTLFVTNTSLLEGLTGSHDPRGLPHARWVLVADADNPDGPPGDDAAVFDTLRAEIDAGPPRLLVVNLHDVDRAGHYSPDGDYLDRVRDVDALIADFRAWLLAEHPVYAEHLLFVVTTDHGRHRPGGDEAWRDHGDACDGCREVPLFLLGGGAQAGLELQGAYEQLDLTPTIAGHLGVAAPWMEGLPLVEAGVSADGAVRSGEIAVAASAGLVATQVWSADRAVRSEVKVDGAVVSRAGAEAPTVFTGDIGRVACFRELTEREAERPWVPRCLVDTGAGWEDVGFATEEVNPYWRAALAERDGQLWAAWPQNPRGTVEARDGTVGLAVAAWTAAGWGPVTLTDGYFPTDAAIVATPEALVGAFGTSLGDPDYRYTRRVRVVPHILRDGAAVAVSAVDFTLDTLLGEGARVELPALAADGVDVRLAMIGLGDGGVIVAASTSADGGRTWTEAVALPGAGAVLPHLAPAWDGDAVVWGALVDGAAQLCRATPRDDAPRCAAVGSPRLQSFTVQDGVATVIRDAGTAAWERATITW